MFKNYLVSALNNLLKHKLHSAINIVGLSVGMAACILIGLYVLDETSYDKHWQDASRIYRVNQGANPAGEGFSRGAGTTARVAPALQQYFPAQIEATTRLLSFMSDMQAGEMKFQEELVRVDASFPDIFDLDIQAGSLAATLEDPGKIALNREVVDTYFPSDTGLDQLLGEIITVTFNGVERDYQIGAIYDIPGNTVLEIPAIVLLDVAVLPPTIQNWGARILRSYVKLREDADPASVMAGLNGFVDQVVDISSQNPGPDVRPSDRVRFDLQPITDAHLNSPFDESRQGGNRTVVIAFSAIAVLVLLIGTINYTILSTAKATQRAREVGMRKTVGASKGELITQFLGESFSLVLPAILLAVGAVEVLLPVFEAMVGKSLFIDWTSGTTWLALFELYVAVSLLGGLYPAFILSHFRPGDMMKSGKAESNSSRNLRNVLVVFQFGISIALIIATCVIYAQVRFAMNRDPGFNRENVVVISNFLTRQAVNANKLALKQQLLELNSVEAASLSTHQPTQKLGMANVTMPITRIGGGPATYNPGILAVDYDFFTLYETPMVAGRAFDTSLDQQGEILPQQPGLPAPTKVIINEAAVRLMGFAGPEAAVGSQLQMPNMQGGEPFVLTIIGVAADTNFFNLNAPPRPELYSLSPGFTDVLSIRFSGSQQALFAELERIWREVMGDEELTIGVVSQNMAAEFAQENTEARLLVSFALLAVIIACLGLYGSSAFSIERRTKEIGIRKVMGAEIMEIMTLLIWQFSKPVLVANIIAWPVAAWAMLTWLQRFPYQIDALLLIPLCILAGAIALSIAWLTVAGNTVKVATTNPVYALRYE